MESGSGEAWKGRERLVGVCGRRERGKVSRPSNTSRKDLLRDEGFTDAVLDFLANTRTGESKEEVSVKEVVLVKERVLEKD